MFYSKKRKIGKWTSDEIETAIRQHTSIQNEVLDFVSANLGYDNGCTIALMENADNLIIELISGLNQKINTIKTQ